MEFTAGGGEQLRPCPGGNREADARRHQGKEGGRKGSARRWQRRRKWKPISGRRRKKKGRRWNESRMEPWKGEDNEAQGTPWLKLLQREPAGLKLDARPGHLSVEDAWQMFMGAVINS